jgi:hypothetical protein
MMPTTFLMFATFCRTSKLPSKTPLPARRPVSRARNEKLSAQDRYRPLPRRDVIEGIQGGLAIDLRAEHSRSQDCALPNLQVTPAMP